MIEELFDNVDNILTARASLSCLLRELVHVKTGLESAVSERERLNTDLQVSDFNQPFPFPTDKVARRENLWRNKYEIQ